LRPGESIQEIKTAYILNEDQALLVRAKERFSDKSDDIKEAVIREPGDKWMVEGPRNYIPPVEAEVIEPRNRIALDKNEGIYVRDLRTGLVRSVIGEVYMLKAHEELWEMPLAKEVEKLILEANLCSVRDTFKVVSYRCPFNSAVQVYDYKKKTSRIVFGPDLVMLLPDEQFTVSVLSGGKPKRPGVITTLALQMGPEFSTDITQVETSDHAVLRLQLSYNWYFKVDKDKKEEQEKIFNVKDFIGDLCNLMAAKIRSAVASVDFDTFHKTSAKLIRKSIFGTNPEGKINPELLLPKNNLVVTNVDIQNVEPVDEKTRQSLQKTVTLAIQISTKKQKAKAEHQAEELKQKSKGELEKLQIVHQSNAEETMRRLLELRAASEQVKQ